MAILSTSRKKSDFQKRVDRVAPDYHGAGGFHTPGDKKHRHPFRMMVVGFLWAVLIVAIGENREVISKSLSQGTLSANVQSWILSGLSILLIVSVIGIALHLLRFVWYQNYQKTNSGGVLMGVTMGFILSFTPASVWDNGLKMLNADSESTFAVASSSISAKMPSIDLSKVTFVSLRRN